MPNFNIDKTLVEQSGLDYWLRNLETDVRKLVAYETIANADHPTDSDKAQWNRTVAQWRAIVESDKDYIREILTNAPIFIAGMTAKLPEWDGEGMSVFPDV